MTRTTISERGIVVAPLGRDAAIASAMLGEAAIETLACPSLDSLIGELDDGAAFVVITEESLLNADLIALSEWIEGQEEWSDLPFILLTRGGGLERNPAAARFLELLGNVTFVERPFHPTTLVSLAKSALRARRRQYEARSRLEELRESETRYRTLFDSIDEGFCIIEFIDGPDGPLSDYVHVEANPAYERHAGIPHVVGQKVREMVGEEAADWVETYGAVLRTGEPIRFERELIATGRFLELSAFRVEPAERRQVAVLFQDVTARKLVEKELRDLTSSLEERVEAATADREAAMAQLREAQKLEMLGQLTGGVAHDFNNLLTPITGALDLLNRRSDNDPRASRLIGGALQSAERAKALVQRLLGFARRQTLRTRAVDLGGLINDMRDLVSSSVGSSVELNITTAPDLPPALADPNQLELAILNLCVNARDAMPDGGKLTLAVEQEVLGPGNKVKLPPGAYLLLSVCDTGTGMDEETLERAIEPFFSTKDVGRGTGLGLSTVHGLAAQLGGAFLISSKLGEGTRADLYLPVAETHPAVRPTRDEEPAASSGRTMSILLVDDEELVRAGTAEMLRELGHTVCQAAGGAEALAWIGSDPGIEVMLTDYMMPGMNGAQLAVAAQEKRPDLAVMVITGFAGGDLDLGFPQLAKPFRQAELAAALQALTGGANVVALPRKR